jgi:glucan phosphoethanolaminetransferase (alkaline phosphatase superfamily)
MKNLFTWKYWFTVNPGIASSTKINILMGLLALLLILAIAAILIKKHGGIYKGLCKKVYNFASTNFIVSLIILFFNYENVPFFSSRMWIGFWAIEMIVWLFFIIKNAKSIPQKKRALDAEKELKKYLP